jgi:hypothetical protein
MSKITLTYDKDEYTLEYSRQSVRTMEAQGFNFDFLTTKPATMLPLLFEGAFMKNHRGIKRRIIDEIYEEIGNKGELLAALGEMYADTLNSLIGDKADEGNVSWAVTK